MRSSPRSAPGRTNIAGGAFLGRSRRPRWPHAARRSQAVKVKRIVSNIAATDIAAARRFYHDPLGLDVLMDLGWIATYGSDQQTPVQISVANEGGFRHACS
jgi:hypothetical protein